VEFPVRARHENPRLVGSQREEPSPAEIVPFGRYGGGDWTGHPIGFLIVVGLLLMGLVGLPGFRWFFAASLALGGALGLILTRLHR